jgi:predicted MFS family arabinose efflux permease
MTELGRARAATLAVFFVNGLGIGAWSAAIPPLKVAFALSDGRLSLILLAFAGGAMSFMPIGGAIAPRWAPTGLTTARAAFAFTLSFALPLLAWNALALAAAAFCMGAANGLLDVSMNAHASVVERQWSAPIMSSFHAAFSVGGLAGAGAAFLYFGASAPVLLAAVGAVGFVVVVSASGALGKRERRNPSSTLAWPARTLFALAIIAFLLFLCEGAIIDWSGVYLASIGASTTFASAGFAAFSIAIVTGRLLGDRVVARYGRAFVVSAGALIAAGGLGLAAGSPHIGSLLLGYAMVGAGLSNVVPALFSASAGFGSSPGQGIAAIATAGYAGLLTGPPFVGAIATFGNLRLGFAALAAAACAGALISIFATPSANDGRLPD